MNAKWLLMTSLTVTAACGGKKSGSSTEPDDADGSPRIGLDQAFNFSDKTSGVISPYSSTLKYALAIEEPLDVRAEVVITSSDCGLTPRDVFVGEEASAKDYRALPKTLTAGLHTIVLMVNSNAPCTFAGTAKIKGPMQPQDGGVLTIGTQNDVEVTTDAVGGGRFEAYVDYTLTLAQPTKIAASSSSWSDDCEPSDFQGPMLLYKVGDAFENLPWTIEAGTYTIRALLTSTKVCRVSGSFMIDVY